MRGAPGAVLDHFEAGHNQVGRRLADAQCLHEWSPERHLGDGTDLDAGCREKYQCCCCPFLNLAAEGLGLLGYVGGLLLKAVEGFAHVSFLVATRGKQAALGPAAAPPRAALAARLWALAESLQANKLPWLRLSIAGGSLVFLIFLGMLAVRSAWPVIFPPRASPEHRGYDRLEEAAGGPGRIAVG